jgi:hypothetical protein
MTLSFHNGTDVAMRDLDVEFGIGQGVAETKLITDLPCSVIKSGVTAIDVTIRNDATGEQQQMQKFGNEGAYRLLCDKLPANTGVTVLVACVNMRPAMQSLFGGNSFTGLVGPKVMPESVMIKANYRARMRPYSISKNIVPTRH